VRERWPVRSLTVAALTVADSLLNSRSRLIRFQGY